MTDGPSWFEDPTTLIDELQRGEFARRGRPEIAGYRNLRELSRGGQGVVYRAEQESTRRTVAIKVLFEGAIPSERRRLRFEREIEAVAAIEHPGIVRVYDGGQTGDDRLYYVMELIDGVPLDEFLAGHVELSLRDRLRLLARIADAVDHAHRRGVIHRDLKPSNILVDDSGQPHVLDFGIAKLEGGDAGGSATVTGQFLGTLAYASPEQLGEGDSRVDVRTDVYALGVLLYRMVTGEHPFPVEGSVAGMIQAIMGGEPVAPRRRWAERDGRSAPREYRSELDAVVLKALAKNPDDRYSTAGALARDLDRYLAGEPLEARGESAAYLLGKLLGRYRWAVVVAALFVAVIAGFGAYTLVLYRRAVTEGRKTATIRTFLEDTFASVEPRSPGAQVTLREALDDAVHWVEIALADDPEVAASLRTTIGNSYRTLELYPQAEEQLLQALEIRRRLLDEDDPEMAQSWNVLGLLRSDQGQADEAIRCFEEALGIRLRHYGSGSLPVSFSHMNVGRVLQKSGRFREAETEFRRSLKIREGLLPDEHPDVAMARYVLAELYRAEDRNAEALELHRRALDARRRKLPSQHPDLARSLFAVGTLSIEVGSPREAEALLRQCLEIRKQILAADHWRVSEAEIAVARALIAQGKREEARSLLDDVSERVRRTERASSPRHGEVQELLDGLR